MRLLTFSLNKCVWLFDVKYRVVGFASQTEAVLQAANGISRHLTIDALAEFYRLGNLKPADDDPVAVVPTTPRIYLATDSMTPKAREAMIAWNALFRWANNQPESIKHFADQHPLKFEALCERLGFSRPPSKSCIARRVARWYRTQEDETSLAPDYHLRGGRGRTRLSAEVEALADWHIDNRLLPVRSTLCSVYFGFLADLKKRNEFRPPNDQLKAPALATFRRRAKAKGAYVLYAAKHGKAAAERKFRSAGRLFGAESSFDGEVAIDHTPLDLFVVDEKTGLALGRPRLTVMLHTGTKAVLGMDFGFGGNSTAAVLDCIKHAVLPKPSMVEGNISIDWRCFGLFLVLKCDNGREFHSEDFKRCAAELGFSIHYCPTRQPWFKGAIERFLGTLNRDFAASLPGASEAHFYLRQKVSDPANDAVITLGDLKRFLHHWVVNIYMQTPHKGLKQRTPQQAWDECIGVHTINLPAIPDEVDVACAISCRRRLQHYGIDLLGLSSFNNEAIQAIRRKYQFQRAVHVDVRYSPHQLGRVWVQDPDSKEWIEVLNSDPESSDLSEVQVRALNRVMADRKLSHGTSITLVEAKRILREEVSALRLSKSQRERRRAALLLGAVLEGDGSPEKAAPKLIAPKSKRTTSRVPKDPVSTKPASGSASNLPIYSSALIKPNGRAGL